MRFNLLSKGRFYDAQCKNVSDVVLKCVSKENKKVTSCFTAEANISEKTSTTKELAKQN